MVLVDSLKPTVLMNFVNEDSFGLLNIPNFPDAVSGVVDNGEGATPSVVRMERYNMFRCGYIDEPTFFCFLGTECAKDIFEKDFLEYICALRLHEHQRLVRR